MVSKPMGQLTFLAAAVAFVVATAIVAIRPTDFVAAEAGLVALALRGGGPGAAFAAEAGRVARFGLLRDGCEVGPGYGAGPGFAVTMINGTAGAGFYPPVRANGYFFVTSDGPEAADPVQWAVWASETYSVNGSAPWRLVGASRWWKAWDAKYQHVAYRTPAARGAVVTVNKWCPPLPARPFPLAARLALAAARGSDALLALPPTGGTGPT
jgi:hypothetical protein